MLSKGVQISPTLSIIHITFLVNSLSIITKDKIESKTTNNGLSISNQLAVGNQKSMGLQNVLQLMPFLYQQLLNQSIIYLFAVSDYRFSFMFPQQQTEYKMSFDAHTDDSQMKAPRHGPIESEEFLPELNLEEQDITNQFNAKFTINPIYNPPSSRKGSLDLHFTILGFIDKKIREKSRQRVMSQEMSHMKL